MHHLRRSDHRNFRFVREKVNAIQVEDTFVVTQQLLGQGAVADALILADKSPKTSKVQGRG